MEKNFYKAVGDRRTFYVINSETTVDDDRIVEVVKSSVKNAPSAFNSQSARVVVLFGKYHDKLWDITKEELRKLVPPENFSRTEDKINSFKAGHGTVLYFEDESVVESLQKKFPTYKDNFPIWSQQSSGIVQFVIWTALETEGLGASLQHYNPLIDEQVYKEYGIDRQWKLIAQMPFGNPVEKPGDKQFIPVEKRVKIFR